MDLICKHEQPGELSRPAAISLSPTIKPDSSLDEQRNDPLLCNLVATVYQLIALQRP
jgi:hypothetical protein